MSDNRDMVQKVWGAMLLFVGVAMFFYIPARARQIQASWGYSDGAMIFMKVCFYIIALVLITGGAKKLYAYVILGGRQDSENDVD